MLDTDTAEFELEFASICGPLSDEFSSKVSGPSPYNGTMPFAFVLEVFFEYVDGEYVTRVLEDGNLISQSFASSHYRRDSTLRNAIAVKTRTMPGKDLDATIEAIGDRGYRFNSIVTGAPYGHVETVTLIADAVSELDAALQLGSDPEHIYDLLDAGADVNREHAQFGKPLKVAKHIAKTRPDYEDVVGYMHACGAY